MKAFRIIKMVSRRTIRMRDVVSSCKWYSASVHVKGEQDQSYQVNRQGRHHMRSAYHEQAPPNRRRLRLHEDRAGHRGQPVRERSRHDPRARHMNQVRIAVHGLHCPGGNDSLGRLTELEDVQRRTRPDRPAKPGIGQ